LTKELTGQCSRCGGHAVAVYELRDAMRPLELCASHEIEHGEALRKGNWKKVDK